MKREAKENVRVQNRCENIFHPCDLDPCLLTRAERPHGSVSKEYHGHHQYHCVRDSSNPGLSNSFLMKLKDCPL